MAIFDGWTYLKTQIQKPLEYFNLPFYRYLTGRVVFDAGFMAGPGSTESNIQRFLNSQETGANGSPLNSPNHPNGLDYAGACPLDKYCLGYTTLFQPLQPGLTSLLLATIAAKDPGFRLNCAINYIEGLVPDLGCNYPPPRNTAPRHKLYGSWLENNEEAWGKDEEAREKDEEAWLSELDKIAKRSEVHPPPRSLPPATTNDSAYLIAIYDPKLFDCEVRDQMGILYTMSKQEANSQRAPRLFLECFRQVTSQLLSSSASSSQPSGLGFIRAAVADFLFHYKMSQQYPHEFVPYDLTRSADRFNSALEPMIVAFNRDVTAFQGVLRARIGVEIDQLNRKVTLARWFNLDKPTFLNDGIVTVNTLSGAEAIVNTTTQSYIDVSTAPSVSALLSAVAGEGASSGNVGTSHLTKPSPGVLSNLTFNQAQVLAGALSDYQSSKAQIGRQLNVDVIPRSLAGDSTAELQVTLKADDSASPPLYSSGPLKGSDPEVSRFATNEITTRVRVDSLKLFEVSSFTAVLRNSRRRLPLSATVR